MNKYMERLYNGLIKENPTMVLMLGMCPTLAVSTAAINGVSMGLSTMAVLIFSNLIISILRKRIPNEVRLPAYIVIVASLVTVTQLIIKAYLPAVDKALGQFIPLIVVNCIILARAEAFASKNPPLASACDGLGMGIGFTLALTLIGSIRELIGSGSIFGQNVLGASYEPMLLIVLASGGFLTFGLLLGVFNLIVKKIEKKNAAKEAQAA